MYEVLPQCDVYSLTQLIIKIIIIFPLGGDKTSLITKCGCWQKHCCLAACMKKHRES